MSRSETIYALSSGSLPAGVGVVRVSGSKVPALVPLLTGREILMPRMATLCSVLDAEGAVIDQALCVHFPAPHSFTGEDILEIQLHGSRAVLSALYARLGRIDGLVPAEPGEFTMRAFLNGRMDLTAAEGLSDLIVAETEHQRKLALSNAGGAQRRLYEKWRADLVSIWARVEADLDFSDQDDVPGSDDEEVRHGISRLLARVEHHISGYSHAEIVNSGFHVVIAGPPNSGKSSLINYLAKRDVAIVTDVPGTTRDLIEVRLDLGGRLVRVTDTAGLRATNDPVERLGIDRALEASGAADLLIFLSEAPDPSMEPSNRVLLVRSKSDLAEGIQDDWAISTLSGHGIERLLDEIAARIDAWLGAYDTVPSKERQIGHLQNLVEALRQALDEVQPELVAERLRQAALSLGRLTGVVDVEELLGDIFANFCIGK